MHSNIRILDFITFIDAMLHQLAMIAVTVAESRLLETKAQEIADLDAVLSVSIVSGR